MTATFLLAAGDDFSKLLGNLLTPGLIILVALAFLLVIRAMATRYKKIPPNTVGIFYGRSYKYTDADGKTQVRGFRIVAGGGSLLWPIVEKLEFMSSAAFQVVIDEEAIPNKDNVKINVKGVATWKISSVEEDLANAAMAFLGKTQPEIEGIVKNILMGHLRSIIGKLGIDEVLRQRDAFNKQVVSESTEECQRLGIQVITLVIQEVSDAHGYIDALGKRAVAEAIRDANIKVAEADAETRKKVSSARRDASVVEAQNEVSVSEAQKDRDVKKAQFKVAADTEQAKANQALAIADAQQQRTLLVSQAERDAAWKEAEVAVQVQEAARRAKELDATVVKLAEAERQKTVIQAEAARQAAVIAAEGNQRKLIIEAEGTKQARTMEGEGEAAKTRAVMVAQAEGAAAQKKLAMLAEAEGQAAMKGQVLKAEAEGTRALLLAQAEGEAAKKGLVLKAEAEGTKQLAAALAQMTTDAKLILVLDRLPALIDHAGEAGSKVATAMFASVAAPFGSIDKIHVIDMGGDGRPLQTMGGIVPGVVFNTLAGLKARGVDVTGLLAKFGVDASAFNELMGQDGGKAIAAAPAAAPAPAKNAEKHG